MKRYYEKWSYKRRYTSPGKSNEKIETQYPNFYVSSGYFTRTKPQFVSGVGYERPSDSVYHSSIQITGEYKKPIYKVWNSGYVEYTFLRHLYEPAGTEVKVVTENARYYDLNDKLIETIIAEDGTYPNGGVKDGYYWIRKEVYINPPTISGTDSDMGIINRTYTLTYTASHESGCLITEQVDDKTLRMYATAGEQNNLTIPEPIWIGLKNGQHTLTITAAAQDGTNMVTTRKYTFTKREQIIKFTLSEPIRCKDRVSVLTMRLLGNLSKARIKVLACNNAGGTNPVWEDISGNVQTETEYTFKNMVGQMGLNIDVEIQGDTGQGIYLSGIKLKYKEGKDAI